MTSEEIVLEFDLQNLLKISGDDELLKQEADYWKQLDSFYKFQNKEFEDIQRLAEKLYDLLHWKN